MSMYEIFKKNLDKKNLITLFGIIITLIILIGVSYKSDTPKIKKTNIVKTINENSDVVNFKVSWEEIVYIYFHLYPSVISITAEPVPVGLIVEAPFDKLFCNNNLCMSNKIWNEDIFNLKCKKFDCYINLCCDNQ